jgi:hypothetical protein
VGVFFLYHSLVPNSCRLRLACLLACRCRCIQAERDAARKQNAVQLQGIINTEEDGLTPKTAQVSGGNDLGLKWSE